MIWRGTDHLKGGVTGPSLLSSLPGRWAMWAQTCGPCGERVGRSRAGRGLAVEGECGPQVQVLFFSTGHGQPCTRCLSGPCSAIQKADIGLVHLGV